MTQEFSPQERDQDGPQDLNQNFEHPRPDEQTSGPSRSKKLYTPDDPQYQSTLNRLELAEALQPFVDNPRFRIFGTFRHGHADDQHLKGTDQDIFRPLDPEGLAAVQELGMSLSEVRFKEVLVTSDKDCTRIIQTRDAVLNHLQAERVYTEYHEGLYRAAVDEHVKHLMKPEYEDVRTWFKFSHGKVDTKDFLTIFGRPAAFLPTGATFIGAVETDSWPSFRAGHHDVVHIFAKSPKATHALESLVVPSGPEKEWTLTTYRP
jgi:phosphohistidine phosphatase SixA